MNHLSMRVSLCQRLTRKKLPHEWLSARERSVDKGDHIHVFFLVDSSETRAQAVLNTYDDCWLALECRKRNLRKPWINGPRDEAIHGDNQHSALPYLGPNNRATPQGIERLVDALEWMSYIYKARDKHDEEWTGQIFAASRPKRSKQIVIPDDMRQQADNELVIKVITGDDLLDQLIAETQNHYRMVSHQAIRSLH
jgi:hypothetical protein